MALVAVHGTGTPLGDPIEVGALAAALAEEGARTAAPALLSSKATFGHTEGSAGLAGQLPWPSSARYCAALLSPL